MSTTRKIARLIATPSGSMPTRPSADRRGACCRCARWRAPHRAIASSRLPIRRTARPPAARGLYRLETVDYIVGQTGLVPDIAPRRSMPSRSQPEPGGADDLDRLAALAYLGGRYELAERLTAETNRPLGLWVRVKLALRRGDRAAAARDWTAALKGTEQAGTATTLDGRRGRARLRGEVAVLRLSQGEYSNSLRLLFPVASIYWGDVIYIAERVLTVDELKAFVDGLPPLSGPQARSDRSDPVANLRALLARRLVRVGRTSEGGRLFPAAGVGFDSGRT